MDTCITKHRLCSAFDVVFRGVLAVARLYSVSLPNPPRTAFGHRVPLPPNEVIPHNPAVSLQCYRKAVGHEHEGALGHTLRLRSALYTISWFTDAP